MPAPVLDQEGALASGTLSLAAVTSSATLNGAVGGRLTCGRFAVNVLPGTFVGTGTVTMTMRDPTVAIVDLSIAPSVLNDFKVAVDLSYDPTGLGLTSPVYVGGGIGVWTGHIKGSGSSSRFGFRLLGGVDVGKNTFFEVQYDFVDKLGGVRADGFSFLVGMKF